MKWLKNLENIAQKNYPGKCPYCNSDRTDYNAERISEKNGYLVVWCNDCKHAVNLSRVLITDDMNTNKKIPTDLIF